MADLLLDIRVWAALIVGSALMVLGDQVGQWRAGPDRRVRTDTITKERTLVRRDTVTETVPRTVVRYDTVRQVDTVLVAVPTDMTIQGVIPPSPVQVEDEVTLTYYDTDTQRWTQNRYDIPSDTWHLWPSVRAASTPTGLQASALAHLRWRQVTVFGGYTQVDDDRGVTVGVELRPFTVSW
jgi:hypothetical protein